MFNEHLITSQLKSTGTIYIERIINDLNKIIIK